MIAGHSEKKLASDGLGNSIQFLYHGLPPDIRRMFASPPNPVIKDRPVSLTAPSRRSPRALPSLSRALLSLILAWLLLIWWGEKRSFRGHVRSCDWRRWERWPPDANPHHLVLIADPQLIDPHTYPNRPWPLSSLTIKYTDLYLRRSFAALAANLSPQSILFLGDLFDGGREWAIGDIKSEDNRLQKYGDETWFKEYSRFDRIFVQPWNRHLRLQAHRNRWTMNAGIPGNHDLGFGGGIQLPVRTRFENFFGLGNRVSIVGNHTFVSVDSVSWSAKKQFQTSEKAADPQIWNITQRFLDYVSDTKVSVLGRELRTRQRHPENARQRHAVIPLADPHPKDQWYQNPASVAQDMPSVILTHVPLYRRPGTPCGPLREHMPPTRPVSNDLDAAFQADEPNAIRVAYGYQYQNVLHEDLSRELVEKVGSVAHVFSGDDHDYCEVVHRNYDPATPQQSIREVTVKSLSWAMGIRKPGFVQVSLWNPIDEHGQSLRRDASAVKDGAGPARGNTPGAGTATIQTHLCLLPDQIGIFIRYVLFLLLTVAILFYRALRQARQELTEPDLRTPLLPLSTPSTPGLDISSNLPPQAVDGSTSDDTAYASVSSTHAMSQHLSARSTAGRGRPVSPLSGYALGSSSPSGPGSAPGGSSGYGLSLNSDNGLLTPNMAKTAGVNDVYKPGMPISPPAATAIGHRKPLGARSVTLRAVLRRTLRSTLQVSILPVLYYLYLFRTV